MFANVWFFWSPPIYNRTNIDFIAGSQPLQGASKRNAWFHSIIHCAMRNTNSCFTAMNDHTHQRPQSNCQSFSRCSIGNFVDQTVFFLVGLAMFFNSINSIILTQNWCWPFWVKIALLSWFFLNYQEEKNDWGQTQKQKYNMHSKIYQFQRNVSPKVTWKRGECAEPLPSKNMKGTRRWREYTTQWIRTPRKFPRQTSNLEHMCENMFWRHVSICYEHAAKMIWG